MKNVIIIFISSVLLGVILGCTHNPTDPTSPYNPANNTRSKGTLGETSFYQVETIDSCEYYYFRIAGSYSMGHKGNCRYCIKRIKPIIIRDTVVVIKTVKCYMVNPRLQIVMDSGYGIQDISFLPVKKKVIEIE